MKAVCVILSPQCKLLDRESLPFSKFSFFFLNDYTPYIKILLNSFVCEKKSHGNLSYVYLFLKLLLHRLNFISKLRG